MSAISLSGISKSISGSVVLDSVNLEVPESGTVGIYGPDGTGKTTLINIIQGTYLQDYGSVCIDSSLMGSTFILHESILTNPGFNIKGYVRYLCSAYNLQEKDEILNRLKEAGIFPNRMVAYLDEEESVLVQLIFAEHLRPRLLVMDEPFTGASEELREMLLTQIERFKQQGTTILITAENKEDIDDVAETVLSMKDLNGNDSTDPIPCCRTVRPAPVFRNLFSFMDKRTAAVPVMLLLLTAIGTILEWDLVGILSSIASVGISFLVASMPLRFSCDTIILSNGCSRINALKARIVFILVVWMLFSAFAVSVSLATDMDPSIVLVPLFVAGAVMMWLHYLELRLDDISALIVYLAMLVILFLVPLILVILAGSLSISFGGILSTYVPPISIALMVSGSVASSVQYLRKDLSSDRKNVYCLAPYSRR